MREPSQSRDHHSLQDSDWDLSYQHGCSGKGLCIFEQAGIPPISEYDPELGKVWCIPTEVTTRKTKTGKPYYQVKVIDSNMEEQKINCWGVDPQKDFIYVNRLYVLEWPQYNETWGLDKVWCE